MNNVNTDTNLSSRVSSDVPDILLADFLTGRVPTGHQEDYLVALEDALAGYGDPKTVAPFREIQRNPADFVPRINVDDRIGRYIATYSLCRRVLRADTATLLIFHGAEFRDYMAFAAASMFRPRAGKGVGVFVMRRQAWAIVGHRNWKSWLLDRTIVRLARRAPFYMLSDSRDAMDHWEKRSGVGGQIVSIPTRYPVDMVVRKPGDPVTVGLIGGFRAEKGAKHYEAVIATALSIPAVEVNCQLPGEAVEPEKSMIASLCDNWSMNDRVRFHTGHLDAEAFTRLVFSVDIVMLPYDVSSYGPGTSGIMFEAVAAGKIVCVTRIAWAMSEYPDHPNVIWMDAPDGDALASALKTAVGEIENRRRNGRAAEISPDRFRETWIAALEQIDIGNRRNCRGMQ